MTMVTSMATLSPVTSVPALPAFPAFPAFPALVVMAHEGNPSSVHPKGQKNVSWRRGSCEHGWIHLAGFWCSLVARGGALSNSTFKN